MKKLFVMLICILMVFVLTACVDSGEDTPKFDPDEWNDKVDQGTTDGDQPDHVGGSDGDGIELPIIPLDPK